jgi:hypothetical protein
MRFRLRTAVAKTHCILSTIKLTIMRFRIRTAVVEISLHIKYYNVKINALSNKECGIGKLVL